MRLKRLLTSVFAFALLSGCDNNNHDDKLTFLNDMETLAAFNKPVPAGIVFTDNAYSGNYVCTIDSSNIFSTTFNMQVKKISAEPVKKVTISAWMSIEADADPSLVLDIMNEKETTIEWLAKPQKQDLRNGQWVWVGMTIDLRAKGRNNPENYLKIYAFNKTASKAFIDNLEIRFEH